MKTPFPVWRRRGADPEVVRALEGSAFADRVVGIVCGLIFVAVIAAEMIEQFVGEVPL